MFNDIYRIKEMSGGPLLDMVRSEVYKISIIPYSWRRANGHDTNGDCDGSLEEIHD